MSDKPQGRRTAARYSPIKALKLMPECFTAGIGVTTELLKVASAIVPPSG
jgi:hypothetical protein